jgi:DNA polymerase-1
LTKIVVFDIETEEIPKEGTDHVKVIWCIVCKEVGGKTEVFTLNGKLGYKPLEEFKEYANDVDYWVAHNGLSFDVPVVNRVLQGGIREDRVVDTFVVSRLVNYTRYTTHSLAEIGSSLGEPKTHFNDWSDLSQEMVDYCIQDVVVNEKIYNHYKRFIWDDDWQPSLKLEHQMVLVNNEMSSNGFLFDVPKAKDLLVQIKSRMSDLEQVFQTIWPPQLEEVNRIQYRTKGDGSLYKNVEEAMSRYPQTKVEKGELVCFDYVEFKPGSPKDRVEKLWQAGWNPTEKTKTHFKFSREAEPGKMWGKTKLTQDLYDEKKEHFEFYGWTVGETNLLTLPEDAPEGAKRLAEWLTLEGRRSSLEEWLGCVQEDSRIHGKFWNIGAWTHRMSHSAPNQANIFSPFHGEVRNAVDQVKSDYDEQLRALWTTDKVLVGTDADGIQLRLLAHFMESEAYREAIVTGSKENETDIHSLNKRALGLNHLIRDDAKTFIYAWLLGAGTGKVASILRTGTKQARSAMDNFLESIPELKDLKQGKIPSDARRGYFIGLDGRKVLCDSEHLMLAGYLQNGEAVAMKRWITEWKSMADKFGLWYRLVDFVHDEVQVEVETEADANLLIQIQEKAMDKVSKDLELFCPLTVSGDIGYNWSQTH